MPSPSRAEGVERDNGLAGVHRDAHVEVDRLDDLVQFGHRVAHRERGPHGALRVVLVGDRCAEHCHDRVADELLDYPAETLDLGADAREVR